MQFQLTPEAQAYLATALLHSNEGKAVGMRVGVKKAGCSGYEYVLEYIYVEDIENANQSDLDFIFSYENINIIVDKSLYIKYFKGGTVIDYRTEGLNEGLKFDNPNVSSHCGCGESFQLNETV